MNPKSKPQDVGSFLVHTAKTHANDLALISRHQSHNLFPGIWPNNQYAKIPDPTLDKDSTSQTKLLSEHECLRWTYNDILHRSQRLATNLYFLGLHKGTPVVVLLDNGAEFVLLFWACMQLGCPFFPVTPKAAKSTKELKFVLLQIAKFGAIVAADAQMAEDIENALPGHLEQFKIRITATDTLVPNWTTLQSIYAKEVSVNIASKFASEDVAMILLTSGTASGPKACGWTSTMCTSAALAFQLARSLHTFDSKSDQFKGTRAVAMQNISPYDAFGINWAMGFWASGGAIVFPAKSFDPCASLAAIEEEGITHMAAVPTMIHSLTCQRKESKSRMSQMFYGEREAPFIIELSGALITQPVMDLCFEELHATSVTVSYGSSEMSNILVSHTSAQNRDHKSTDTILPALVTGSHMTSVGKVTNPSAVRICVPDTSKPLHAGEIGELHVSGPSVIHSYLGEPVPSESFYKDEIGIRWFKTGDQGTMTEDGNFYVFGRYKDIIIRGGVNLSPAVIEACLNQYRTDIQSQVIGFPDETVGEVPIAVIHQRKQQVSGDQRSLGNNTLKDDLWDHVRLELGLKFTPHTILDLKHDLKYDEFPLTTTGKINKSALTELVHLHIKSESEMSQPDDTLMDIEEKLRKIWATALGRNYLDIPVDRDMLDFADSLIVLKVSACVLKEMDMDLSSQDIYFYHTIHSQAEYLESNPQSNTLRRSCSQEVFRTKSPRSEHYRPGPPNIFYGLPHLCYSIGKFTGAEKQEKFNEGFKKIKGAANDALRKFGLSWADVEDVLPMPPTSAFTFEYKMRAQSWVFRTTLTTVKSCEEVLEAMKSVLANHPIFRTVVIRHDGKPLHLVVRPSPQWLKQLIVVEKAVEDSYELQKLLMFDPAIDTAPYATEGGPLFRAIISHVRSTNTAGLIIVASHGNLDAISMSLFEDDIATCLALGPRALKPHSSYRLYACNYALHLNGVVAQENCEYFARRLYEIHLHPNALWPPHRYPENNVFRGSWHTWWKDREGNVCDPSERKVLDGEGNARGVEGLSHIIKLPYFKWLRNSRNITAPVLLKAAVVLFNISQTDAEVACFGLPDAARLWPFSDEYSEYELKQACDPPSDINGPTWEFLIDRVHVTADEQVGAFLERLQREQAEMSVHAQAPLESVLSLLPAEDALMCQRLMNHQVLNWIPDLLKVRFGPSDQAPVMTRIQVHVDTPGGYLWSGSMLDPETMLLNGSYDDGQYYAVEVHEWLDMTLSAVEWLCDPENWGREVGECTFESKNVVSLSQQAVGSGMAY